MFKVNNKDTRTYFTPCSSVSIVNFEQVKNGWGVCLKCFVNDCRLAFIDERCENIKVVVHGGGLTRNFTKKKKQGQTCRCSMCNKCYRPDFFFNKHVEICESV